MKKQDNSRAGRLGWRTWAVLGLVMLARQGATAQTVPDREPLRQCGSVAIEQQLQSRFSARGPQREQLNNQIRTWLEQPPAAQARARADVIYRIPVVVHVVHNTANSTIGGSNNPNISDAQIQSQIQVLNEDYRRVAGTPGGTSTNPLAADMKIEFFLATTDPTGQPSTGITRHFTQKATYDLFNDLFLLSSIAYWPSNRYLNIWTVTLSNRNFLGFGQFPTAADTLQGLGQTDERIDGVVIDHRYFGRRTGTVTSTLYCCGRTTTHEIGHWLGLIHPTGDTFCGTDYVADTPPTEALNETDRCDPIFSRCRTSVVTRNQIENYMDYTPDACMNLFTNGQRDRVQAVLALSPRRVQLIQSLTALPETERLTVLVSPNPANAETTARVQFKGQQSFQAVLYNSAGRLMNSQSFAATLSRQITLALTGFQAGVYILRVNTPGETVSQRIVVR